VKYFIVFLFVIYSIAGTSAEVINAGEGGNTTRTLLSRLKRDVLDRKPSLVLMMVGTNDMLNSKKLATFRQYRNRLETLIKKITANKSKIILMTIPPCNEKYLLKRHKAEKYKPHTPTERIIEANKIIKNLAKKYSIPLVDVYSIFTQNGVIIGTKTSFLRNVANVNSEDGVHPTPAGYKEITKALVKTIKSNKLPTAKIICFGDSITYGSGVKHGTEDYPAQLEKMLR
jgi:lysophospholipase L1-like esterase